MRSGGGPSARAGRCRRWRGTRSASTSTAGRTRSCSTASWTRSFRATATRCGDSVSDLPPGRGPAPHTRPRASAFGADAYPTLDEKAGALLHSLARKRALVDGNEQLTLAATIAFYG